MSGLRVSGVLRVQQRHPKTGASIGGVLDAFEVAANSLLSRSLWPPWFVEYVHTTCDDLRMDCVYVKTDHGVVWYDDAAFQRTFNIVRDVPEVGWLDVPALRHDYHPGFAVKIVPIRPNSPILTLSLSEHRTITEVGRLRLNRAAVIDLRDRLEAWLRDRGS